jgi:hypothetical protein
MNTSSSTDSRVARESGASVTPASWDPYEVWLTRVKLPRELVRRRQVPRDATQPVVQAESDSDGLPSEPSLA